MPSIDGTLRPTFLRSGVAGLLEASVDRWPRFFVEAVPAAARSHHAQAGARYAADAAGECMPFIRCESEKRTFNVLAVPDTDLTTGQVCDLDAVAVVETH
jgi:hypothetical protein